MIAPAAIDLLKRVRSRAEFERLVAGHADSLLRSWSERILPPSVFRLAEAIVTSYTDDAALPHRRVTTDDAGLAGECAFDRGAEFAGFRDRRVFELLEHPARSTEKE
jgi:hypothetical protein